MAEIFVSYVRHDNDEKAISKFVERLKLKYQKKIGENLNVFIDFKSLEIGDNWDSKIENAAKETSLLLAFLSPSYFKSNYCGKEWDIFHEKSKNEESIIFPIVFESLEDEQFDYSEDLEPNQKARFLNAQKLTYAKLIDIYPEDMDLFIEKLCFKIKNSLKKVIQKTPNSNNTNVISEDIDCVKNDDFEQIKLKILERVPAYPGNPVCVIYTGGTVGMVREETENKSSVLRIGGVQDIIDNMFSLKELEFNIDFFSYKDPLGYGLGLRLE